MESGTRSNNFHFKLEFLNSKFMFYPPFILMISFYHFGLVRFTIVLINVLLIIPSNVLKPLDYGI
jgi:hypothetical protein